MQARKTILWLCTWLGIAGLAAPAAWSQGWGTTKVVKAELLVDRQPLVAGETFKVAAVLTIDPAYHINANPAVTDFIPTTVAWKADGVRFGHTRYPAPRRVKFDFADKPLLVYEHRAVVWTDAGVDRGRTGKVTITAQIRYQACNANACKAPAQAKAALTIPVAPAGSKSIPAHDDVFRGLATVASNANSAPPSNGSGGGFDVGTTMTSRGAVITFLLLFLGGLSLNLTPCVFPLIPVTVTYFGAQAEGNTSRSFLLALCYALGIAVTYSVIGVVAASTGSLFGGLLQKPGVLIAIAAIMVALALSSFGLWEIRPPAALAGGSAKQGLLGALAMGLVMGLVASPCVGPLVIGLLIFVGKVGNPWLGFAMFFTLAAGLGVPYVVLGTFAGSIRKLPRSGAWMLGVKNIFGVVLLGMAVYFLKPLLPAAIQPRAIPAFALAGAVYLLVFERSARSFPVFTWIERTIALLAVIGAVAAWAPQSHSEIAWQPYSEHVLAAAKAEGKPVVIDFWANWCLKCIELDHKTFSDPGVAREGKRFVMVKADLTRSDDPQVKELVKRYAILGLPTNVFLDSHGNEVTRLRLTAFEPPREYRARLQQVH